ncbi:MAG: hypothetical protein ACM31C_17965 [Acidobacteriota bacterium]
MTRQFHARVRRRPSSPKGRVLGPHTLSFRCYRLVAIDEPGQDAYEIVEVCDPRNAMRVLVGER